MSWRGHLPPIEFSRDELEQLALGPLGRMGFDAPDVLDRMRRITIRDLESLSREDHFRWMSYERVGIHWNQVGNYTWYPATSTMECTMEDALCAIVSWATEALEEHWNIIGRFEAALKD
ncbi:hypothetical protein NM208_g10597 [Fusarium decemcellulare]|uniref:Uncharacterized protein n=1 Tax=Fusarium decemcellulare TaxID=57161 RepID=A0ACC1RXB3_9HYPO|nr:hypothetical protein NM208_g10597 [Fusarium decemcellulare]